MNAGNINRIRLGTLALVVGGVIAVVGEFMRGPLLDPSVNPAGFAQLAAAPNWGTAWTLILLAATLSLFGTLALYGHLAGGKADSMAFWGVMLSLAGGALFLVFTGTFAYADPVVARLYLQGDQGAIAAAVAGFFQGPATAILYPSGLIGTIGSILVGIAIWRSGTLPRWAGLLFAIHTPLLAFASAFSYPLELLGGVCLLATALWVAPYMWRATAPDGMPAGHPAHAG
jgi:hypothetical protein